MLMSGADASLLGEGELKKLKAMQPMSAEATVIRNYLDVLLGLPWGKKSKVKKDIGEAQKVLDADHYGLEKVKDRIIEYLAVQARTRKLKGPILCLVGPPGVGKSSFIEALGLLLVERGHRVAARPKPRHRKDSLVPEDKDKPVMRCQNVAKSCRLMRAPAYRQHQHHHEESDNPTHAEQSDLGSYQSLQHDVPVLREPWVPTC